MLPNTADIKAGCTYMYIGCNVNIGYLVQGLVAKVKDTVANGYFWLVCGEPLHVQCVPVYVYMYVHISVKAPLRVLYGLFWVRGKFKKAI